MFKPTSPGLRPLRARLGALACCLLVFSTLQAAQPDQIFVVRNHATVFEAPVTASTDVRIIDIVLAPEHGTVTINADQTLTFQPLRDVCETQDRFSYEIELDGVVERIDVTVDILCEALTVISNFSPNGDGQNDTFTILGIQNYPGNQLSIYAGNGLEVFSATDYDNDWAGTDAEGQALEGNGTVYYYVLKDGGTKSYAGILTIE